MRDMSHGEDNVIKFPKYPSKEYDECKNKSSLIFELGEVIIEQYGEKEAIDLLQKYKSSKQEDKKD